MEITREDLRKMFATMVTIRQFELRAFTEVGQRSLRGALHLSVGQEGVPTGICAHLSDADYLASTHRGHGHCIAKGVDVRGMMAEILQRSTGTNKGKGGSMHIADMAKGMLGANGVVGSSVPARCRRRDGRQAARLRPGGHLVLRRRRRQPGHRPREHEPRGHLEAARHLRLREQPVRGVDAGGVRDAHRGHCRAGARVQHARRGRRRHGRLRGVRRRGHGHRAGAVRPGADAARVQDYRYYGHAAFDNPKNYRTTEEEDAWKARDVLAGFRERVTAEGLLDAAELDELEAEASQLVDDAVQFADESPMPDLSELLTDVYVDAPENALSRGAHL